MGRVGFRTCLSAKFFFSFSEEGQVRSWVRRQALFLQVARGYLEKWVLEVPSWAVFARVLWHYPELGFL